MIRRDEIADDNQQKARDQISKARKRNHADNISASETPSGIEAIADCAAGNNGMTGVVADRKADKSGKNPFPRRKFPPDVAQGQIIIRRQRDIAQK